MWKKATRFMAVGLEMGLAVFIGYLGGAWLDSKFDTEPVLGLCGLVLGVGAAGKALWDTARKAMLEEEKKDEET
jgi:ATP synthase protein I